MKVAKVILNSKLPGSIYVESESDIKYTAEVLPQEHHQKVKVILKLKVKVILKAEVLPQEYHQKVKAKVILNWQ